MGWPSRECRDATSKPMRKPGIGAGATRFKKKSQDFPQLAIELLASCATLRGTSPRTLPIRPLNSRLSAFPPNRSFAMSSGWIVLGLIVVLVLFAMGAYNRLVTLSQRVNQAFADIDV